MVILLLIVIAFAALMVLAPILGAESRPGFDARAHGDRFGALR